MLEGKCRVLKLDSDEHTDMASALNVSILKYLVVVPTCWRELLAAVSAPKRGSIC